ncbi:hypothetical protein QQF64_015166 [Cirrhinus molitorella]|uniref:Ig-like domain-containing protein n=1 Tax=Cirrhinus molitorella TaxID=172907 RepID=A0ABR3NVF8_9TELE
MCLSVIFILVLHIGNILTNMITSHDSQKQVLEGKTVTLTCNYSGVPDNLHWYRQYPRSTPKFLLYIYESGLMSDNIPQRFTPRIHKNIKQVDLEISSVAVSDSAVYYCALRPTVTGNKAALYENMNQRNIAFEVQRNHQTRYRFFSSVGGALRETQKRLSFLNYELHSVFSFYRAAMMFLCTVLLLSIIHDESIAQKITPLQGRTQVTEGMPINLSCRYDVSVQSLLWYRQYPGSGLEFLLLVVESSKKTVVYADPPIPRLDGEMIMLFLFCLWLISLLTGDASSEGIAPVFPHVFVSEGKPITLSCNYDGSAATDALHWYRQYPGSRPDFLYLVNEAAFKQSADPPIPGISAKLNEEKNRVDLEIIGTALNDSALYYCALQPTLTGNTHTLSAKMSSLFCLLVILAIQGKSFALLIAPLDTTKHATERETVILSCKYDSQYPGSKPEFVLLVMEASTKHVTYAVPRIPGMDGKMSVKDKQVDLEISSVEVLWLILFFSGDASGEGIAPLSSSKLVTNGESITLTCNYNGSYNSDYLLWYRQYSSSKPEFLFLVSESNLEQPANPPIPGVSAQINEEKNRVDLKMSFTSVSDSAMYYCALKPTVTENPKALYKIKGKTAK